MNCTLSREAVDWLRVYSNIVLFFLVSNTGLQLRGLGGLKTPLMGVWRPPWCQRNSANLLAVQSKLETLFRVLHVQHVNLSALVCLNAPADVLVSNICSGSNTAGPPLPGGSDPLPYPPPTRRAKPQMLRPPRINTAPSYVGYLQGWSK